MRAEKRGVVVNRGSAGKAHRKIVKRALATASALSTTALFILILLFILGCEESQPAPPVRVNYCGDGTCSPNEVGVCGADCGFNSTPIINTSKPDVKTQEEIINDLRSRRNTTVLNSTAYVPDEVNQTPVDQALVARTIETVLPETGFVIGSRYNLLSINENISGVAGVLTGSQLHVVLKGGYLQSNTEAFGPRAASYQQFLTVRSGRVVFGLDDNTDVLSTYLQFKEGDPIFDYLMRMNGGIFKFFEGQIISFLGHDYIITGVTNTTMTLAGLSTPDQIIFRNNHSAIVNGRTISGNALNVTMGRDYLRITFNAEDDMNILPGTGIVSHLVNKDALLTNRLDLVYEGLTDAPYTELQITLANGQYRLKFVSNMNLSYDVPLARANPLQMGGKDGSLVYQEGKSSADFNIKNKDYFLIDNNKELGGLTNMIRLLDVSTPDNLITFEDPALEKFLVYFQGTPGKNATADLVVYNVHHKIYVGANQTIAVDLNGDGSINGGRAPIVTGGNLIIRINSNNDKQISMTFVTPGKMRENVNKDLATGLMITSSGIGVDKSTLAMEPVPGKDALAGLSDYGTEFIIKKKVDDSLQSGDTLIIRQPAFQRFANVIIKAYE